MDEFVPVKKADLSGQDFNPVAKLNADPGAVKDARSKGMTWGEIFSTYAQPVIEGLGLVGGGMVGSGVGPAGTIGGAAGGYSIAKKMGEIARREIDARTGDKTPQPDLGVFGETDKSIKDLATGATIEMGGASAGKLIQMGSSALGRFGKQAFGKLTGAGAESIDQAVKSGQGNIGSNPLPSQTVFDKAMRGQMTGDEVVGMARDALSKIKDARSTEYLAHLRNIENASSANLSMQGGSSANLPAVKGQVVPTSIDPKPIIDKLQNLTGQYRISLKVNPQGEAIVDTTQAAMGKSGRNDIAEVIKEVGEWKDFSPLGLDALKRRVADFYSDSSQARQFVSSLEKTIKDTIVKEVPEYAKMTKGYEEATRLIKDIESNLMMRKEGMSGRIVSDQTLRRLMSAMKENFELRKGLVEALQVQGGEDVMGAVAGYNMKSFMPRGITGTGAAIIGSLYAAAVKPAFWPLVVSSSPRVAGEFLRLFGKYSMQFQGAAEPAGMAIGYGGIGQLAAPPQPKSVTPGQGGGRLILPDSFQPTPELRMR
jgi:hypothetical protein